MHDLELLRAGWEYRSIAIPAASLAVESRAADGTGNLTGYASVTDTPYEVEDWLGSYTETIARGAFLSAIGRDDVVLTFNHDRFDQVPMARTTAGTLRLAEDDIGLAVDADLDMRRQLCIDVASALERGDLASMSFVFRAVSQTWSPDYTERTIEDLELFDVSVVTNPANPATSVQFNRAAAAAVAQIHRPDFAAALDAPEAPTGERFTKYQAQAAIARLAAPRN